MNEEGKKKKNNEKKNLFEPGTREVPGSSGRNPGPNRAGPASQAGRWTGQVIVVFMIIVYTSLGNLLTRLVIVCVGQLSADFSASKSKGKETAVADSDESFPGLPNPIMTIEDGVESVLEPITQVGVQAAEKGMDDMIMPE
ncbi:hypothetical protein Sjap_000260 [Stephania japonica]|uniref:Uncharacterized protein n=1 Tax=Stephania japonica TaxID=461633 RepID=A0AAP0KIN0_9MAGN